MEKLTFELPDNMVKETAVKALEYSLQNLLMQYELKFNIRIDSISLKRGYGVGEYQHQTGRLASVHIGWQETGAGVRTNDEVRELLEKATGEQLARITEKLAGNG